jgi:hypothetical protein
MKLKITEHQLQSSIFKYIELAYPKLRPFIFAIPNGGQRNIGVARKLKAEGATAGVWDIFVSLPNLESHGLYIECKVGKNDLTLTQINFRNNVEPAGYKFCICRSLDDFKKIIDDYFRDIRHP